MPYAEDTVTISVAPGDPLYPSPAKIAEFEHRQKVEQQLDCIVKLLATIKDDLGAIRRYVS